MIKLKIKSDTIICILISFMIMSFNLFELMWWGRYVLIAVTLIVILIYASKNNWHFSFKLRSYHFHVIIFSMFCLVSSLWAWNSKLSISKSVTVISLLICYSFLYLYYEKSKNIDLLLKAIMFSGYGIALYTIIYYGPSTIISMLSGGFRLGNDFTNANSLGIASTISCIIQVYFLKKESLSPSILFVIPALLILAASQSRKAVVILLIGVCLMVMQQESKQSILRKICMVIIGLITLIVMIYFLSRLSIFEGVTDRFSTYFQSMNGSREENIRDIYRQIGYDQFRKTPIFGIGMGNSVELLESMGHRRTYLHDNFVEILSSGGIIGFIVYYSMYIHVYIGIWKNRQYDLLTSNICLILLTLIIIMDYGMVSYFDKQQYIYLMCFYLQYEFLKKKKWNVEC